MANLRGCALKKLDVSEVIVNRISPRILWIVPIMQYITELVDSDGNPAGPQIALPANTTTKQLNELLNSYLKQEEDPTPYSFYVNDEMVVGGIDKLETKISSESVLKILYRPESVFGIRPVSFCSASLPGHTHTVLCIAYSPDGLELATGGGDGTVIFWDPNTQTLKQKVTVHAGAWIQCIKWYPDAVTVATAGTDGVVNIIKKGEDGTFSIVKQFKASTSPIFAIEWEPMHLNKSSAPRIAVATKKGEVNIYHSLSGIRDLPTSGHEKDVMCLAWDGQGRLYSASHDMTVKAWDTNNGACLGVYTKRLGQWRTIALSSAMVLRTGGWELGKLVDPDMKAAALKRYQAHLKQSPNEIIAVGSADHTISLLRLSKDGFVEVARATGHNNKVNHLAFSPNGYWLASASFDKTVKIFDGRTGAFVCTLGKGRGRNTGCHLGPVYRVAWSADSRLLISASKDTTLKVWDIAKQKMLRDLPGHSDEVFDVDWSQAGGRAASGGKDKTIRLWGA